MFQFLIVIEPLGLLYGSMGRFLSPENLVGRSGISFPPSAATASGIVAAALGNESVQDLCLAGPFWAKTDEITGSEQNFYVPTPFNYLVKNGRICHKLSWKQHPEWEGEDAYAWLDEQNQIPNDKFENNTWLPIQQWHDPKSVELVPWKPLNHLHPRLDLDQRRVAQPQEDDDTRPAGSLFLETAFQLDPDSCLVYLSNKKIADNWYRFGGEGHLVNLTCIPLKNETIQALLNSDVGNYFALITPALWGSNRLSYREPQKLENNTWEPIWTVKTCITARPNPFRYRMGGKGKIKRLSRGRYAVPAGTVYVTAEPLPAWHTWNDQWFPKESRGDNDKAGFSAKRWGCGLALSLPTKIASSHSNKSETETVA